MLIYKALLKERSKSGRYRKARYQQSYFLTESARRGEKDARGGIQRRSLALIAVKRKRRKGRRDCRPDLVQQVTDNEILHRRWGRCFHIYATSSFAEIREARRPPPPPGPRPRRHPPCDRKWRVKLQFYYSFHFQFVKLNFHMKP
ncbi:hypothetical protein EVAR_20848_1 [Eumeta japonica]|uniref:Uncharacterized protein n=1 Tax=Eumeta variegata TaxID=151549 RepID=A0A4C1UF20_EUMVA|nr:hypothetical protein EVAR_20848_1 [Eumeta japonica]